MEWASHGYIDCLDPRLVGVTDDSVQDCFLDATILVNIIHTWDVSFQVRIHMERSKFGCKLHIQAVMGTQTSVSKVAEVWVCKGIFEHTKAALVARKMPWYAWAPIGFWFGSADLALESVYHLYCVQARRCHYYKMSVVQGGAPLNRDGTFQNLHGFPFSASPSVGSNTLSQTLKGPETLGRFPRKGKQGAECCASAPLMMPPA